MGGSRPGGSAGGAWTTAALAFAPRGHGAADPGQRLRGLRIPRGDDGPLRVGPAAAAGAELQRRDARTPGGGRLLHLRRRPDHRRPARARENPKTSPGRRCWASRCCYVQEHDPAGDGRVRAAYAPTPLASPADVSATDPTSDVGNMAWVGQALVHLYERTGTPAFLSGARELAQWIQTEAFDERGAGGYTGGEEPDGTRISLEVHRAQHRPVRVLQPAGGGHRGSRLEPGRGPRQGLRGSHVGTPKGEARRDVLGGHRRRRREAQPPSAGRGRQQLVLPGPAGPRLRLLAGLGREEPGREQEGLQRGQLLPARPQGGVVRGDRAHRGRPARAGRTGRRRSRRALPVGHRTRPAGRG